MDNPPGDEVQDLVRVPDLEHVRPGPRVKCSEESGLSSALKFLLLMDLVVGATLLTNTDATTGELSVVASERTRTLASMSLVTQKWPRTDS
jgi:hypothetical protein